MPSNHINYMQVSGCIYHPPVHAIPSQFSSSSSIQFPQPKKKKEVLPFRLLDPQPCRRPGGRWPPCLPLPYSWPSSSPHSPVIKNLQRFDMVNQLNNNPLALHLYFTSLIDFYQAQKLSSAKQGARCTAGSAGATETAPWSASTRSTPAATAPRASSPSACAPSGAAAAAMSRRCVRPVSTARRRRWSPSDCLVWDREKEKRKGILLIFVV